MNRALLVGINAYPEQQLRGCVNDVTDMADFLVGKCNFEMGEIRLLVDERATKQGILERLGWLLTGIRSGDRVLFHYSGHGAQLPTRNPQGEVDGLDEVICPVDFDWTDEHTIKDKEFHQIFSAVPEGVEFVWISDSCCSQDLTRKIITFRKMIPPADIAWRIETANSKGIKPIGFEKTASSLNLALISGCESNKTSADAVIDGRPNGALTYFLLQELSKANGMQLPLTQLVVSINKELSRAGFEQRPQLEGSEAVKNHAFL